MTAETIHFDRPLSIKARRTTYVHKPIAIWYDRELYTEDGQIYGDLAQWNRTTKKPHLVVTQEVGGIIDALLKVADAQLRLTDSRPLKGQIYRHDPKLASFGVVHREGKRRVGQHAVMDVGKFFAEPSETQTYRTVAELFTIAKDIREYCKRQNIPIKTSRSGLAATLATDKRFIGEAAARVPKLVNEAVREHLPGVRHRHTTKTKHHRSIIAYDQTRAYHRAVQTIVLPDPRTIYARGDWHGRDRLWLTRGDKHFQALLEEHRGLLLVSCSQPFQPNTHAPRVNIDAWNKDTHGTGLKTAIWSSELKHAQEHGLRIEGIYAAWTSPDQDISLMRYGLFAENELEQSTPERRKWLKPTLHARYGLLGARPRQLSIANLNGKGKASLWRVHNREIPVYENIVPGAGMRGANVVALGLIQSEIETRTLQTAYALEAMGHTVTHTHADGLHAVLKNGGTIPAVAGWTAEPMTDLTYEDNVSWTSREKDVLPGRHGRERRELLRAAARRRHAYVPDRESIDPRYGMFD